MGKMEIWFVVSLTDKYVDLLLECGVRRFLFNFYYIRHNKIEDVVRIFKKIIDSGGQIFLDSGGLQLLNECKGKTPYNLEYYEKYFAEYVEFLLEVYQYLTWFAELDIDAIKTVGYAKVKEWRTILKNNNLDDKCVWVWHQSFDNDKFDEWMQTCRERKFLAIGFAETEDQQRATTDEAIEKEIELVKIVHIIGRKVHLLGVGNYDVLSQVKPDSIDTRNWMTDRGQYFIFEDGELFRTDLPLDAKAGDEEYDKRSAMAFLEYEKYVQSSVFEEKSEDEEKLAKQMVKEIEIGQKELDRRRKIGIGQKNNKNAEKYPPELKKAIAEGKRLSNLSEIENTPAEYIKYRRERMENILDVIDKLLFTSPSLHKSLKVFEIKLRFEEKLAKLRMQEEEAKKKDLLKKLSRLFE